jgi:hypothetical protein
MRSVVVDVNIAFRALARSRGDLRARRFKPSGASMVCRAVAGR